MSSSFFQLFFLSSRSSICKYTVQKSQHLSPGLPNCSFSICHVAWYSWDTALLSWHLISMFVSTLCVLLYTKYSTIQNRIYMSFQWITACMAAVKSYANLSTAAVNGRNKRRTYLITKSMLPRPHGLWLSFRRLSFWLLAYCISPQTTLARAFLPSFLRFVQRWRGTRNWFFDFSFFINFLEITI